MGMSLQDYNERALREANRRRRRDGRQASDRCVEDYMALPAGDPRRHELTRVISALSFI